MVVAGGAGAVGSMFAKLWADDGAAVTLADPATDPADDIRAPGERLRTDLAYADVVVLAVPESVALAALDTVIPLLRPDAVLVETLSVKSRFAAAVAATTAPRQVIGVNPMFAPALGLPGRAAIAVIHRGGPGADDVVTRLRAWGAHVDVMTADRHDRLCAAMQALTHAVVLSFGLALGELALGELALGELALGELGTAGAPTESAPPPYTVLTSLLARITLGTPEVYHDVQSANPYAAQARSALARAVTRVERAATASPVEFAEMLTVAGAPLGDHNTTCAALCARLFEDLAR